MTDESKDKSNDESMEIDNLLNDEKGDKITLS